MNRGKPISVYEYWQLNKLKLAAQKSYLDKWNAARGPISGRPVDVLLTPTMPHTAVPHRSCRFVLIHCTITFNLEQIFLSFFPPPSSSSSLDISDTIMQMGRVH